MGSHGWQVSSYVWSPGGSCGSEIVNSKCASSRLIALSQRTCAVQLLNTHIPLQRKSSHWMLSFLAFTIFLLSYHLTFPPHLCEAVNTLAFRQTDQTARTSHYRVFIFALSADELEFLHGRPFLEFKRPEDLDGNGAVDVMTRHWIGNRRVDKLGRKEPDQFIDVTKRCIRYRIDAPLRSLEDSLFLELFFTKWYNCCGRSLKVLLDFRAQRASSFCGYRVM